MQVYDKYKKNLKIIAYQLCFDSPASFSNFIRTVFYVIMFYYLFKFLARLFLPMLVKKAVEKAGENFQKQQQYAQDAAWKKAQNSD